MPLLLRSGPQQQRGVKAARLTPHVSQGILRARTHGARHFTHREASPGFRGGQDQTPNPALVIILRNKEKRRRGSFSRKASSGGAAGLTLAASSALAAIFIGFSPPYHLIRRHACRLAVVPVSECCSEGAAMSVDGCRNNNNKKKRKTSVTFMYPNHEPSQPTR